MTPEQKELIVGWFFAVVAALLTAILVLGMTGCTHQISVGSQTTALTGHLDRVQDNLSKVDSKSVVIEQYLRSH